MRVNIKSILADGLNKKTIRIGLPVLITRGTTAVWGIMLIFVIRVLPSEAYASFAVARSFEMFGLLLGGGFIMQALMKFAAEGDGRRETELTNAGVFISLGIAFVVATVLFFSGSAVEAFYDELKLANLLRILAVLVITSTVGGLPRTILLSRHRTREHMYCELVSFITRAGIVGTLLASRKLHAAEQIFSASVAGSAAAMILSLMLARKLFRLKTGTTLKRIRELFTFAWYSLGTAMTNFIYTRTDILMIGKLARPEDVAAYGACRAITGFFANINKAANMILLPLASRMWNSGRKKEIIKRVFSGIIFVELLIIPFVLIIAFAPGRILHLIYAGKYDDGRYIFLVLALLALARPFGSLFAAAASGIGKPVFSLQSLFVSAGFNLSLNFILIPRYGGLGAAIATVVAVLTGGITVFARTYNYYKKAVGK